ncbi:unnamed protein product [Heligmosomoides polygyrus]|uniref:Astacin domain-containing protein n=1 Tax=Heligmosomoides polygyrus TaxID=6339 RepID=A0A183FLK8_HELPZ|nr:unnamed protein product [Heligmosomoides polygyrus]
MLVALNDASNKIMKAIKTDSMSKYQKTYFTRWQHWNWNAPKNCRSGVVQRGICILGVEYLSTFTANKVNPNFDFGTVICMGELLHNKTLLREHQRKLQTSAEISYHV